MRGPHVRSIVALGALWFVALTPWRVEGQSIPRPGASDSAVFRRAQQLISAGNAAVGRALVDSVLAVARDGSRIFVDALYWRAVFSEIPEQSRKDYLRITVEFAQSPRAEWALLRLAQLETSRGSRAAARRHLDRLLMDHPDGPTRPQAQYQLGRVLLDDGAIGRGCAALGEARVRTAPGDVELQNQITYALRSCSNAALAADSVRQDSVRADSVRAEAAASAARHADSVTAAKKVGAKTPPGRDVPKVAVPDVATKTTAKMDAPRADMPKLDAIRETPRETPAKEPAPKLGNWTVQLAAYQVLADAERLSAKMKARGFDVRVTSDRPYRVRIGRFETRADAVELVNKLAALQVTAIVMEAEKP